MAAAVAINVVSPDLYVNIPSEGEKEHLIHFQYLFTWFPLKYFLADIKI